MAQHIYITSAEGNTGKSTIALGLLETLKRAGRSAGVYRPVSRSSTDSDEILNLLLDDVGQPGPASDYMGATYDEVHADPDATLSRILARYKTIEDRYDVVVILGSDYTDVSSPTELSYNAGIAANLGAPVLLVLGGRSHGERAPADSQVFTGAARTAEEMFQTAEIALAELVDEHVDAIAFTAGVGSTPRPCARRPSKASSAWASASVPAATRRTPGTPSAFRPMIRRRRCW